MSKQPEALRLACECAHGYPLAEDAIRASVELRRQHALIQDLANALREYIDAAEFAVSDNAGIDSITRYGNAEDAALDVLAKAEAMQ